MSKIFKTIYIFTYILFATGIAYAQQTPIGNNATGIRCQNLRCIDSIQSLASFVTYFASTIIIPGLLSILFIGFVYRLFVKFIYKSEKIDKDSMEYIGTLLLVMFVTFAIWGIIQMLANTINIDLNTTLQIPRFE